MAGSNTHEGMMSPRSGCFAYLRHHAVKSWLHPSTWRSATIVGYIPFVPAPMYQSFAFHLYLPVITREVSGFCTDTDSTFRAEYLESMVPESPFFSQLHEHCYWLFCAFRIFSVRNFWNVTVVDSPFLKKRLTTSDRFGKEMMLPASNDGSVSSQVFYW